MADRPIIIPVTGGVFNCPHCGARWVGTWRGPVEKMTCRWCDKPMREIAAASGSPTGEKNT